MKLRRFLFPSLLIILPSLIIYLIYLLFIPTSLEETIEIEIKKGMSFSIALESFCHAGLIRNKALIVLISKITGLDKKVKNGVYSFSGSITPYNVIRAILTERVSKFQITIPEGYNIWQIARRLEGANVMAEDRFYLLASDKNFLHSLKIDAPSIEGYIFPDTYRLPKGTPPEDVLEEMVFHMRRHFTKYMKERMQQLNLSEREVLTLASIIEKEAKTDYERFLISAVFHNRLKSRMPLQADPTSIYGIKDISQGITSKDLQRESPYNTYLVKGLPPGPIASPSLKSIVATLYPADVPYLYFVSQNNGRHSFSTSITAHKEAIREYRSRKRSNYSQQGLRR